MYTYTFDDLDINAVTGSIDVTGISATPTDLAYERLNNDKDKLRFLINFTLDEMDLEGFDVTKFLTTGEISCRVEWVYRIRIHFAGSEIRRG